MGDFSTFFLFCIAQRVLLILHYEKNEKMVKISPLSTSSCGTEVKFLDCAATVKVRTSETL